MSNKPVHRHMILAFIVIAQVFFIALLTLQYEREIASAPHIETLGEISISNSGIFLPYQFHTDEHASHLGRSIWWNALTDDDDREGSSRPRPDEATLPNSINLSDFTNDKVIHLCAIWTRREDGIWDYRLEAPNAVEAQLREGEWRSPALLEVQRQARRRTYQPIIVKHPSAAPAARRDDPEKLEYLLKVDPLARINTTTQYFSYDTNRHSFVLSKDDADTISKWKKQHSIDDEQLPCTIIFSLREGKSPIAVTAKINGIPVGETIRRMREDSFPIPASTK